jgi:hypothetical protein
MSGFIAAVALQQLRDMEQLQRDFGRRPARKNRRAAARAAARVEAPAVAKQRPLGAGTQAQATRPATPQPTPKSIMH